MSDPRSKQRKCAHPECATIVCNNSTWCFRHRRMALKCRESDPTPEEIAERAAKIRAENTQSGRVRYDAERNIYFPRVYKVPSDRGKRLGTD